MRSWARGCCTRCATSCRVRCRRRCACWTSRWIRTGEFVPISPTRRRIRRSGYLPQATAIAIGRAAAGAGPLALLYLGRLANAVAAVLVIANVRLLAYGRRRCCCARCCSMELFEYGSVSQDAMVIAAAALFTAIDAALPATRPLAPGARWRWPRWPAPCSVRRKIVYAPLLVIGLPAALRRGQTRHVLAVHGIIIAVGAGVHRDLVQPHGGAGDPAGAWRRHRRADGVSILADPLRFAGVLLRTFAVTLQVLYYLSTVGLLGWLTLPFPDFFYALPVLGLLFCLLIPGAEAAPIAPLQAAWNVFLVVASAALLMTVMSMRRRPGGDADIGEHPGALPAAAGGAGHAHDQRRGGATSAMAMAMGAIPGARGHRGRTGGDVGAGGAGVRVF